MTTTLNLNDMIILITGASSGIGFAAAEKCLSLGAKIGLHGRSMKQAKEACLKLDHPNVKPIIGDLSDMHSYDDIINQMIDQFGGLHGLVNNAGIFPRNDINNANHDDFDLIMDVNCRAPLFLIKAALPHLRQQKGRKSIVNIGSVNAHCGQNDLLIYSMSKGALQTMTRNMSDTLSLDNICINQLNVGWTHSEKENQTQLSEGRSADWFNHIPRVAAPFGKILSPDQIAEHIAFWLSSATYPISGQVYECEQYSLIGRNNLNNIEIS